MNSNDLKYQNYLRKKVIRYVVIFLSIVTIFLEALALFQTISYVWGLIPFCLTYLIKYFGYPKEEREKAKLEKEKKKAEKTKAKQEKKKLKKK